MSADLDGPGALDAERVALTLPGTIPGLVQMGSRVVRLDGIGGPPLRDHIGGPLLPSYTVVEVFDDYLWIARTRECLGCEAGQVAMDLTDATGRAHAAWWLGGVGASLHLACDGHRRWELHGGERPRESALRAWEGIGPDARRLRGVPPEYGWDAEDVPALATLDPTDPRLLPDGSRRVDAEALRRVCLHVAGLEVTP